MKSTNNNYEEKSAWMKEMNSFLRNTMILSFILAALVTINPCGIDTLINYDISFMQSLFLNIFGGTFTGIIMMLYTEKKSEFQKAYNEYLYNLDNIKKLEFKEINPWNYTLEAFINKKIDLSSECKIQLGIYYISIYQECLEILQSYLDTIDYNYQVIPFDCESYKEHIIQCKNEILKYDFYIADESSEKIFSEHFKEDDYPTFIANKDTGNDLTEEIAIEWFKKIKHLFGICHAYNNKLLYEQEKRYKEIKQTSSKLL